MINILATKHCWSNIFVVVKDSDIIGKTNCVAKQHPRISPTSQFFRYQHIRSDLYAGSSELSVLLSTYKIGQKGSYRKGCIAHLLDHRQENGNFEDAIQSAVINS